MLNKAIISSWAKAIPNLMPAAPQALLKVLRTITLSYISKSVRMDFFVEKSEYASSTTTIPSNLFITSTISFLSIQLPVGLLGEHIHTTLVCASHALRSLSAEMRKLSSRVTGLYSISLMSAHTSYIP